MGPRPAPELRADAELAVALLEATQTIVCLHDREGRFVYFNHACEEATGYTAAEALGRDARELVILPEQEASFSLLLEQIWSDRMPRPGKGAWRTRDGLRREILFFNQPLLDEDGSVRFLVSTGLDITEQERDAELLQRMHDEQSALRRVATFVASGALPEEVAQLVTEEAGRLLAADSSGLVRYDHDRGSTLVVGLWVGTGRNPGFPIGAVIPLEGDTPTVAVYRTGRSARIDAYEGMTGEIAESMRRAGYASAVSAPITVAGRLWGALLVTTSAKAGFPADTEARLGAFAELVALALASADAREQLAASRIRIVEASDAARRRIERDLHDGAQQRLVSLAVLLRLARTRLEADPAHAAAVLAQASSELEGALAELRELARGIHPPLLVDQGLGPALALLTSRAALEVDLAEAPDGRFPPAYEAAVYFVVSEALANAVKHAGAAHVVVRVRAQEGTLVAEIADDGPGGAEVGAGSGLRGLADRVEALNGELEIESPSRRGTTIRARLPLPTGSST